jgi:hypothetical protein
MKIQLGALAIAAAMTFSAPLAAQAGVFTIDSGVAVYDPDAPANVDLLIQSDDGVSFFFATPFLVTGSEGSIFNPQASETFLAFCLNPFADAPMGGPGLGLGYFDAPVPSTVRPLISDLVEYGTGIYNSNLADLDSVKVDLAAVQGAIWQVLFPSTHFVGLYDAGAGGFAEPLTSSIASLAGGAVPHGVGVLRSLSPRDEGLQGIGLTTTDVPEPDAWVLMLTGFAALGFVIRRRRLAAA